MRSSATRTWSSRLRWWAAALSLLAVAAIVGIAMASRPRPGHSGRVTAQASHLQSAWVEFDAGRYDQAVAILDRRDAEGAATALDWVLRARIAQARKEPEKALNALRRVSGSDPYAPQAWLMAGQIERGRHRFRAAEAAFRQAVRLKPDQVQARRELAYIYALQRRRAECDAEFKALSRLIAFDYKLAFYWAQSQCGVFDPEEAIEALTPVVEADPEDRRSRRALADDYRLTSRLDLAEATLRPLPDDDPDARAIRAWIAIDRGNVQAAACLVLGGGHAENGSLDDIRGLMALKAGDPERAADAFRAALQRDPTDRDAIHGLGMALRQLDDPRADEYLHRTTVHDRLKRLIIACGNSRKIDLSAFDELGELCESLGRMDQARVWYDVAISWDPLDAGAQRALARLRKAEQAAGLGSSRSSTDRAEGPG